MSVATTKTHPVTRPKPRYDEVYELRFIQGIHPRHSLMTIVAFLVVIALASMVTSVMLNTRMVQASFEIRKRQLALNELKAQSQTMRAELDRRVSPTELKRIAGTNDMMSADKSGFVMPETGIVKVRTPTE